MPPQGFAERLRTLRKQLGLSQTELGKRVGVHYTHIGRYETGKSEPLTDTLKKLADVLKVTTDYLIDGSTQEVAQTRLTDNDLIIAFRQVEKLSDHDKMIVKRLLDAFLAMQQIRSIAGSAS
jgi:transcriptional regulator with XRE-family HTH domain